MFESSANTVDTCIAMLDDCVSPLVKDVFFSNIADFDDYANDVLNVPSMPSSQNEGPLKTDIATLLDDQAFDDVWGSLTPLIERKSDIVVKIAKNADEAQQVAENGAKPVETSEVIIKRRRRSVKKVAEEVEVKAKRAKRSKAPTEDVKQERKKEQNRAASLKYRMQQKQNEENANRELEQQKTLNDKLKKQLKNLQKELKEKKQKLAKMMNAPKR